MNLFLLLAAETQTPRKVPAGEAALISLIGFILVILVLAVLAGLLYLFKLAFSIKIKSGKKAVTKTEQVAEPNPIEDEEVVAAIAAVIACLDGESGAQAPFKVKSITKLK